MRKWGGDDKEEWRSQKEKKKQTRQGDMRKGLKDIHIGVLPEEEEEEAAACALEMWLFAINLCTLALLRWNSTINFLLSLLMDSPSVHIVMAVSYVRAVRLWESERERVWARVYVRVCAVGEDVCVRVYVSGCIWDNERIVLPSFIHWARCRNSGWCAAQKSESLQIVLLTEHGRLNQKWQWMGSTKKPLPPLLSDTYDDLSPYSDHPQLAEVNEEGWGHHLCHWGEMAATFWWSLFLVILGEDAHALWHLLSTEG